MVYTRAHLARSFSRPHNTTSRSRTHPTSLSSRTQRKTHVSRITTLCATGRTFACARFAPFRSRRDHVALADSRTCAACLLLPLPARSHSYAGAPLLVRRGDEVQKIGTLCIIDQATEFGGGGPRPNFSLDDRAALQDMAATIVQSMELRLSDMRAGEAHVGQIGNDHRLLPPLANSAPPMTSVDETSGRVAPASRTR